MSDICNICNMRKNKLELNNFAYNAYCLVGNTVVADLLISTLENEHGIVRSGNQDFFYSAYDNFSIDDARSLKQIHEMRPVTNDGKKIFVIVVNNINIEAQNALLKLLEEPASYAHFFIIIPESHILISTVRSRLYFVDMRDINESDKIVSGAQRKDLDGEAGKFVALSPAKRLEFVKKLADEVSKDKKTKQDVINFIYSIQDYIYREKGVQGAPKSLEVIETALKYINDRSPSVKMLLEYIALNINMK